MFNWVKTAMLMAAIMALFGMVGGMLGGKAGMMLALVFGGAMNLFSYWFSDSMVLKMYNAQQVDQTSAPQFYAMIRELSQRAGLPMPKVYIINENQPNAFATGRNPQNSAVAVSSGLLRYLEPREVAAVISHELAHIKNRDTLTMTIAATLAGAISMLAQFGLFFGGGNSRDNPLGPIGVLLSVILAPIAAALVQMAVSRTREYEADKDGAAISGDPLSLASALQKISSLAHRTVNVQAERNPAQAHMYIFNPLNGQRMDNLFSTHPNVENRIAQLQRIAGEMRVDGTGRRAAPRFAAAEAPGSGRSGWRVPSTRPGAADAPQRGPWG